MQNLFKSFGTPLIVLCIFAAFDGAMGAASRAMPGRAGGAMAQRMPTMPIVPISSVGNISDINLSGFNNTSSNDTPGVPVTPDNPDNPDTPDTPSEPECPDGGVRDSSYTVENCMSDLYACVNGGGLTNGIAAMYNPEIRNSIINGMGLCMAQVERCVTNVRRNCQNVYLSNANVWVDFNSRRVQPEYYNFVLRKTGLTPYQAENTCLLLDRNTYGASFDAVNNDDITTYEYANEVHSYNNQQLGDDDKKNPMGAAVNDDGLWDAKRGYYARWDASNADCLVRVAAYNKDNLIRNKWWFGGTDEPAEVWKAAGTSFVCNKDLFGFALKNITKDVAAVGIGGGALTGGLLGLVAGAKEDFDCDKDRDLERLQKALRASPEKAKNLNGFLMQQNVNAIDTVTFKVDGTQCAKIKELFNTLSNYQQVLGYCGTGNGVQEEKMSLVGIVCTDGTKNVEIDGADTEVDFNNCSVNPDLLPQTVKEIEVCKTEQARLKLQKMTIGACVRHLEAYYSAKCNSFKNLDKYINGQDVYCNAVNDDCVSQTVIRAQVSKLEGALSGVKDVVGTVKGFDAKDGLTGMGIGTAVGAGAGAIATGITAAVESRNINCRVGDGLDVVALNKGAKIDSLKDFYVKWALNLPDNLVPTSTVVDCASWNAACGKFVTKAQCDAATVNYRDEHGAIQNVGSACEMAGSVCIASQAVAHSYAGCPMVAGVDTDDNRQVVIISNGGTTNNGDNGGTNTDNGENNDDNTNKVPVTPAVPYYDNMDSLKSIDGFSWGI